MNTFLAWLLIIGLYLNIFVTQALVREVENNHGKEATIVIITKTHEIMVAPKLNKESQND